MTIPAVTNAAASPPGTARGRNRRRVGATSATRSTRKVRQSPTSVSKATRYHSAPCGTSAWGSTWRPLCSPWRFRYAKATASWSRQAAASAVSTPMSASRRVEAVCSERGMAACRSSAARRSLAGSTATTFVSARTAASAILSAPRSAMRRRPSTTATASVSSITSGGREPPGASWYPPPTPRCACTGYPRSRSCSTSRRSVRGLTSRRRASSSPGQNRWFCSSESSSSTRVEVDMISGYF